MLSILLPVIALFGASITLSAYVFIRTPAHYYLRLAMIFCAFLSVVVLVPAVNNLLGWAYPHALPDKFTLLGSRTLVEDGMKTGIEVWIGGPQSRLLLAPYSRKLERALEEAKKKAAGGGTPRVQRLGRPCPLGAQCTADDYDDFVSNLIMPYEFDPKFTSE